MLDAAHRLDDLAAVPGTDTLGPAIHPGEILLEEFLRPLEMTQAAAKTLGTSMVRLSTLQGP